MSRMFEALEPRRLLSAVITQTGGALVITNAQSLQVSENSGAVTVFDNTTQMAEGPFLNVTSIKVYGANTGDSITYNGTTIGAQIFGGNGNDNIAVFDSGSAGSTVNGGNGNDTITAGMGHDTILDGDNGGDTIIVVAGSATVNGGNGNDTIVLASGTHVVVQNSNGTDTTING